MVQGFTRSHRELLDAQAPVGELVAPGRHREIASVRRSPRPEANPLSHGITIAIAVPKCVSV